MWNRTIGLLLPLWSAGIVLSVSYAQDAAPKSGDIPLEYPTRIVVLRDEAGRPVPDVPVVVRTDVTLTTDAEGRIELQHAVAFDVADRHVDRRAVQHIDALPVPDEIPSELLRFASREDAAGENRDTKGEHQPESRSP